MIDLKLLEQTYGAEALIELAKAFTTFEKLGLYELVIHANMQPLIESFDSDADALSKRIISAQQTNRFLLTMKEKGREIQERYNPDA